MPGMAVITSRTLLPCGSGWDGIRPGQLVRTYRRILVWKTKALTADRHFQQAGFSSL